MARGLTAVLHYFNHNILFWPSFSRELKMKHVFESRKKSLNSKLAIKCNSTCTRRPIKTRLRTLLQAEQREPRRSLYDTWLKRLFSTRLNLFRARLLADAIPIFLKVRLQRGCSSKIWKQILVFLDFRNSSDYVFDRWGHLTSGHGILINLDALGTWQFMSPLRPVWRPRRFLTR